MSALAQIKEHVQQHPNPVASLWLALGGTDLETQVMFAPGCEPIAHARIEAKGGDYPLAHPIYWIGSNGRNWVDEPSVYLFFDIDADNHVAGHGAGAIQQCIDTCPQYVTMYRSKSGKGLGAIVCLDPQPFCLDRATHQAWGDRLRAKLKADGFPAELIDVCGGNGWFWADNVKPGGYSIIQEATRNLDPDDLPAPVPPDRKLFNGINDAPPEAPVELMAALNALGCVARWDAEHRCLHTHSWAIAQVHKDRHLPGRFVTISEGRNLQQANCFFYPSGPWSGRVVRFGKGCKEHESWTHGDWTSCEFGKSLSFESACKFHGGLLTESGSYSLPLTKAAEALVDLTGDHLSVPDDRPATISKTDSGITVDIDKVAGEQCPEGFRKYKRGWRLFVGREQEISGQVFCGVRHGAANEWFTYLNGNLIARSKSDCVSALSHMNDPKTVMKAISKAAANPTPIVKVPFKGQLYNDSLNPDAPQLCCDPQTSPATPDQFPTWQRVFIHTGRYLDEALSTGWGAEHGIDGAKYIAAWLAIALKTPEVRLPFLAFFGGQLSGKSSFATAISVLVPGGVYGAAKQLRTDDKFDCNMEGMPFVFCDEVNLSQQTKFEYLKPWITESHGTVRAMYQAPRRVTNYTHWIQAVNRVEFLPIFDDVSRITALRLEVIPAAERVDSDELKSRLRNEAPAVLRYLFDLPLPPGDGRLALPAVSTDIKDVARSMTDDPHAHVVKTFISEHCRQGEAISVKEFKATLEKTGGPVMKQNELAALLTNCGYTIKTRKGYPYLIGYEVRA